MQLPTGLLSPLALGMDPTWQRLITPATALLRLGILVAVAVAGAVHVEVAPAVRAIAAGAAVLYGVAYLAVWLGKLPSGALGHAVGIDGLLLGALLGGAGAQAPLVGLLALVVLALAHLSGGGRLVLLATLTGLVGWTAATLAGTQGLLSVSPWTSGEFRLSLEPEATYHGGSVFVLSQRQLLVAAVACFLLVSVSACVAFLRALRERRRVALACVEVDSLEDIVDCYTSGAADEELWRVVADSASLLGRAPALVAYRSGDAIRFAAGNRAEGDDAAAFLSRLEIPLTARENPVVESIESGRVTESSNFAALVRGAMEAEQGSGATKRRKLGAVVTPLPGDAAALVAVTSRRARGNLEGLRIVAERAAMVRQARLGHRGSLPELDPIDA